MINMSDRWFLKSANEINFEECLRYLNRSDKECLHSVEEAVFRKWLFKEGEALLFEVSSKDDRSLAIQLKSGDFSFRNTVNDYVNQLFDLDRNLDSFYQCAQDDEVLKELIPPFKGLRIVAIPDLFECLCWSVIGQQINLQFAYSLKKRMVENWGHTINIEERSYFCFPRPDVIADLEVADFMPFQFSRRKAEYIIGIAQLMQSGALVKEELQMLPSKEIEKHLVAIRGVGQWTAQYVLMKCFQRPEAYPIQDAGLHNAIKKIKGWDRKPNFKELEEYGQRWTGWQAYATFYLWQSLL